MRANVTFRVAGTVAKAVARTVATAVAVALLLAGCDGSPPDPVTPATGIPPTGVPAPQTDPPATSSPQPLPAQTDVTQALLAANELPGSYTAMPGPDSPLTQLGVGVD